jgi:DNA primase
LALKPRTSFAEVKADYSIEYFFNNFLNDEGSGHSRYSTCPSCGTSSENGKVSILNSQFRCFKCGAHGDIIEAASLFYGCSKNEAVMKITGVERPVYVARPEPVKKDPAALLSLIQVIVGGSTTPSFQVQAYLLSRRISVATQNRAISQGLLRFLPNADSGTNFQFLKTLCGLEALEGSGLLSGVKQFAPASYRPLIFVSKDGQALEFRLIRERAENESKVIRYGHMSPFWIEGKNDSLLICEGAMDLLSAMEMGGKSSIMGLPGVNSWSIDWFKLWIGKKVFLALDDDKAGKEQTLILREALLNLGCDVELYQLPAGAKDLNEQLMSGVKC